MLSLSQECLLRLSMRGILACLLLPSLEMLRYGMAIMVVFVVVVIVVSYESGDGGSSGSIIHTALVNGSIAGGSGSSQ